MKKIFVLMVTAVMIVNSVFALAGDNIITSSQYKVYEETYNQCPFEDAIIVSNQEYEFLGKPVGTSVDCINYDSKTNRWVTWTTNAKNEKLWQAFPVQEYKAFTIDGELIIKDNKVFITEINYVDPKTEK